MCHLYSNTTDRASILALFRVVHRCSGDLPPMPGDPPDYPARVISNTDAGTEMSLDALWHATAASHRSPASAIPHHGAHRPRKDVRPSLRGRAVRRSRWGHPVRLRQGRDTAANIEDEFALHISIIASKILEREINIVMVLPRQLVS